MRRPVGRRRAALTVVVVGLLAGVVTSSTPPMTVEATSIVPFGVAFTTNDNGSIAIFGNNLMVCPATAADCAGARAGANTRNNNSFNMVHHDEDGAAFPTFSSSSAQVVLPDGAEVRWAGLYWGARLGRGTGGVAAVGDGRQMKLRAPGDTAYRTINVPVGAPRNAGFLFGPTSTSDRAYQAFADVTSIVRAAGPGTYFGADVPAATGEDRYSGWSLVVVYRSPSLPLRNLTVFDGLADVGQNDPQSITISGFTTPVTGTVNTRIGLVAYEGDNGMGGDRANFNGTQLGTSLSQGTNFFNGANDDNGTLVTARTPADRNMLGFDIKNFDAPGILRNNVRSARIDLVSTQERYFPGVVTTAIDVFAPDFSPSTKTVTNLTGGDPARVGDTLRYTVTFVNAGQDPAINTSIEDPIPAGTSYVPGSLDVPAGVTGSFDSAANTVRVSPGDFPVGRSVTFTFDVLVGAAAANTNVSNQATIVYDGATVAELQDLRFTTGAAAIAVVPSADLVVTKVNTPDPVVAGQTVTSTITVRNGGPSPASDVVVTDELPAGVGGVTATTSRGGLCVVNVRLLSCPIGTIAAGDTVTVTVQTAVPPGSTAASLTDVARVASSTSDPDPDDNTAGATTDVTRNADLSVTKSVAPATVAPGEELTYTVTVTNNGPSTATSVVIDDDVPDPRIEPQSASSVPAGACSTDPSNARCAIASLAPGASAVMTVNAIALPSATPGAVANQAIVSSATPDSGPSANMATSSATIGPAVSDLDVTKTADAPSPLVAGLGVVRYTINVTNEGPSDADPVTVTDVLPPGFNVVLAIADRGNPLGACDVAPAPTGDTVTCDLGRFIAPFGTSPGASGSVTIAATVPATVAPGDYPNAATVSAPSSPPTSSPPAPVTVETRANVSITKAFSLDAPDAEITPGTTETYRIRVVNEGPSVADDVVVTDALPAGLTATAWRVESVTPPGPTPACVDGTATCTLGDLPPGTTVELELDVLVDDGLVIDPAVGVANIATVALDTDDPNEADNTSTFTASGQAQADLQVRKFAPSPNRDPYPGVPAPVAGLNTSYVVEVTNFGPSATSNVVTTDLLPPGVRFVRAFEPFQPDFTYDFCTGDGATPQETVTCNFTAPPLPPDFGANFGTWVGIEVALDPTIPDGTVLSNTVTVTHDVEDGNPGNNAAAALVPVRAEVNLRVEKLVVEMDANGEFVPPPPPIVPWPRGDDPLGVPPGRAVSFAVIVTNEGPSAATDVQFIDAFPVDAAYFPVGPCEFLNGETICRHVDGDGNPALLLPEQTFGVQIITVLEGDTPPGVYTNTARATTSTDETTLADNGDARPIEVIEPEADLIIEKEAVTSPLVAGETFTYQISVSAGVIDLVNQVLRLSSDAENVVVTDTLPAGLVPAAATSSQGSCTVSGQNVTCDLGTVESSISLERQVPPTLVTITGSVAPGVTDDEVTNRATASTSTPLLDPDTPIEASVTTPIERSADLAVTKVADSTTATAGGGVTFTVTVTNTGPSDATNVVVTDLLPAPLVFSTDGSDDECSIGAGGVVCTLGTVTAGTSRALTIAATLPPDAAPGEVVNTASVTSDVDDPDDTDDSASVPVAVTQAADLAVTKTSAAEGVLLGGTIAYTLTVVNEGPSDATGVELTETIPAGTTVATLPPGCTGTGPVTCTIGDLTAGGTVLLELVLEVPDTLPPGPLDNVASVTSDIDDPDQSDNSATATVEAVAQADVAVTKELVTPNPVAGEPLEFRLIVVNNGPTVAPNASISDTLAPGLTFMSGSASQGMCTLDESETAAVTASCDLGRMEVGDTVTATLVVDTDPSLTTISNIAFAGSGGLDISTLDNEDSLEFALQPVADLSVTKLGPATVSSAAPVEYVIGYRNDGPSTATDVVVSDTLPTGLTPRPITGCTISGATVSCGVASLAPDASGSVTITADVDPALPLGTALTDVAAITSTATGFVDPDRADNTFDLTSTVDALNDVGVTVTANQDEVPAGAAVSFTVVVTNHGPQLASDVVLTNQPPPEVVAMTAVPGGPGSAIRLVAQVPPGCQAAGVTVTCQLGDLAVGQSQTLVFEGTVAAGTPAGTTLVHTATVTFDGTDAVEANNSDADTILVIAVAPPAPTTTTTPSTPTTTSPAATTTTIGSGSGSGGGGSLPMTGAAIAGLLAVAALLVLSGGGFQAVTRRLRPRPRPD